MAGVGGESGSGKTPKELGAEGAPDLTAAAVDIIPPEILAQSLGQYFRAWFARVRSGDAGVLPALAALLIVGIVFQITVPNGVYLNNLNLAGIFDQSAVFIILAIGEGFILLLGEIDLSLGYIAAIGGVVAALLVQPQATNPDMFHNWPWWGAIIAALVICVGIGAINGFIVTRLCVSSLIVTLASQMVLFGMLIVILGQAGSVSVGGGTNPGDQKQLYSIVYGYLDVWLGWVDLDGLVRDDDRHPRTGRKRLGWRRHQSGGPEAALQHRLRLPRCLARLGRSGARRAGNRRFDVAARLEPTPEWAGRAACGLDPGQDRHPGNRRRDRRIYLQPGPPHRRELESCRRSPVGRASRSGGCRRRHPLARENSVRAPCVRGRRESGSGPARRRGRHLGPHLGLRDRRRRVRAGRRRCRVLPGGHLDQLQRRPGSSVRRRRRGHRWHEPVRRSWPGDPRPAGRSDHRRHLQRPLCARVSRPDPVHRHGSRTPCGGFRRRSCATERHSGERGSRLIVPTPVARDKAGAFPPALSVFTPQAIGKRLRPRPHRAVRTHRAAPLTLSGADCYHRLSLLALG